MSLKFLITVIFAWTVCILFHTATCGLGLEHFGLGLGLDTAGLGLGTAGLDYKSALLFWICSGPVVRSYQTNLIWINGHMPSDNLVEQNQSRVPPAVFKVTPIKITPDRVSDKFRVRIRVLAWCDPVNPVSLYILHWPGSTTFVASQITHKS